MPIYDPFDPQAVLVEAPDRFDSLTPLASSERDLAAGLLAGGSTSAATNGDRKGVPIPTAARPATACHTTASPGRSGAAL